MPLVSQKQSNVHPSVRRRSIVHFMIAEKEYGFETEGIKEVIFANGVIPLPGTPDDIEGVIALRGTLVPIIHLGKRLKQPAERAVSPEHVVIVEVFGKHYGVMVDQVREVLEIDEKQIDRPEDVLDRELDYIKEVCRFGEKLIFIVDLKRLWTKGERDQILPALNRLSSKASG